MATDFGENIDGFNQDNNQVEQNQPDLQSQVNTLRDKVTVEDEQISTIESEISSLEASIAKNKKLIFATVGIFGLISIVALISKK